MKGDLLTAIAMAASMGGNSWGLPYPRARAQRDELEGVDIAAEYKLVQQKKSQLSRRLRDEVIFRYKRMKAHE